jgi:type VI secretion system protein
VPTHRQRNDNVLAMPLILRVISYRDQPPPVPLSKTFDQVGGVVGRGQGCDLVIPDPDQYISRKQAQISYVDGDYYVSDIGTHNPTSVNGQALGQSQQMRLADGDVLVMGEYRIEVAKIAEPILNGDLADSPVTPAFDESPSADSSMEALIPSAPLPAIDEFEPFGLQASQQIRQLIPEDFDREAGLKPSFGGAVSDQVPELMSPMPSVSAIPEDYDFLSGGTTGQAPVRWGSAGPQQLPPDDRMQELPSLTGLSRPVLQEARLSTVGKPLLEPMKALGPAADPPDPPARESINRAQAAPAAPSPAPRTSSKASSKGRGFGEGAGVTLAEGVRTLLAQAGASELEIPEEAHSALMLTLGKLLHEFTQGTVEILLARTLIREEMRASRTLLKSRDNNPLKFAPPEEALRHLLMPRDNAYLPPVTAVREAFSDLKAHELAMMSGIRAALAGVLDRYSPAQLEKRLEGGSALNALPMMRKAKLWDLFTEMYAQISTEIEDDFQVVFGDAFVQSYEEQLERLRGEQKAKGRTQ